MENILLKTIFLKKIIIKVTEFLITLVQKEIKRILKWEECDRILKSTMVVVTKRSMYLKKCIFKLKD